MGQLISTTTSSTSVDDDEILNENNSDKLELDWLKIQEELDRFDVISKSGMGVHMFEFKPPMNRQRYIRNADNETIYVGSEVMNVNNIVDVRYTQWEKQMVAVGHENDDHSTRQRPFEAPTTGLKTVWRPRYTFSSPRVAMVAVKALLNRGYQMTPLQADTESE